MTLSGFISLIQIAKSSGSREIRLSLKDADDIVYEITKRFLEQPVDQSITINQTSRKW